MGSMNKGTLKFLLGLFLKGSFGQGFADSFWRGIRLQRRRGEEKKAPETRQHRQDKPRQANTSQGQPPRSDDLQ